MSSQGTRVGASIRWDTFTGRDGWSPPTQIAETQGAEGYNVTLERTGLAQKRMGWTSWANAPSWPTVWPAMSIYYFVPGQDMSAGVILTGRNGGNGFYKLDASTNPPTNTAMVEKDAETANSFTRVSYATLNGKCYIAYDSAVNRLHVFDPTESATAIRRVGLATPAAPTAADTGSGSYAAVARYYRVAWRTISGSDLHRQSLLGPASTVFTPSGSGTHAQVTQPTVAAEGETHWAIFGSTDNAVYYELAEVAIGTTTYDDNEAPATEYDDNTAAPLEGAFTPWPSVKYLVSTGDRLVGYGAWETTDAGSTGGYTPKAGRVFFSPVLDTTDTHDDERVSNTTAIKGWIDVARNAGGEDRALAWFDNTVFVFQSNQIHMLVSTGDATAPFRRVLLSPTLGAVSQASTFVGKDRFGRPALYWLDPQQGPMRYGADGIEWMGYDVRDIWAGVQVQAFSAKPLVQIHGCFMPSLRACVFWIVEASDFPTRAIVCFVDHAVLTGARGGTQGGWVLWEPSLTAGVFPTNSGVRVMASGVTPADLLTVTGGGFSSALAMATGMYDQAGATPITVLAIWPDVAAAVALNAARPLEDWDNLTTSYPFQAYVTSRAFLPFGSTYRRGTITRSYLQAASTAASTVITQTLIRNFGEDTNRTSTVDLVKAGSETRVFKRFEDSASVGIKAIQVRLGDASEVAATWTLDAWEAPIEPAGEA